MGNVLCGKEDRRPGCKQCSVLKEGEEAVLWAAYCVERGKEVVLWALHCVERRRGGSVMGPALCGKEERRQCYGHCIVWKGGEEAVV
jgi:hypothetical protein